MGDGCGKTSKPTLFQILSLKTVVLSDETVVD